MLLKIQVKAPNKIKIAFVLGKFYMHTENILMFGGRGSGKSSVLAAILDQAVSMTADSVLSIKLDRESAEPVLGSLQTIQSVCRKQDSKSFSIETPGTANREEYSFDLGLSSVGAATVLRLTFIDTAGEWMANGMEKLNNYFSESRAAILAIDAVELMQGDDVLPSNFKLHRNLPPQTRQLVAEWIATQGHTIPRLLCIVPIKTETYLRERPEVDTIKGATKLTTRIRERYDQTFQELKKNKGWTAVVITPVQTVGNIIFDKYVTNTSGKYPLELWRNIKGVETPFQKPTGYEPVDCEQPLRHILNFFLVQKVNANREAMRALKKHTWTRLFFQAVGREDWYENYVETLIYFKDIFGENRDFIDAVAAFSEKIKTTQPFEIVQGEHLLRS